MPRRLCGPTVDKNTDEKQAQASDDVDMAGMLPDMSHHLRSKGDLKDVQLDCRVVACYF